MKKKNDNDQLQRLNAIIADRKTVIRDRQKLRKKAASRSVAESLTVDIELLEAELGELKMQQKILKRGIALAADDYR